ncbi:MAG: alpha/beta fold hydrolase [Polyangiaceae bacterium]|nr:alpha/beta fold hydrolase [Polyangiaceae bacterium]
MQLAASPRDVVLCDGSARLYRFRTAASPAAPRPAVLCVPSLINKWYVLDLRRGASVVEALGAAGCDVYCLDWGEPGDEDRYLEWDEVLARLGRMARAARRLAGAERLGLLGYCMGGTLAAIHAALEPESVGALVNLAGPIDFGHAGILGHLVQPRWFDPEAIASAGNMTAGQMQAGFAALRPTAPLAKWVSFLDKLAEPEKREAFEALEAWASDNVAFPAAAYVRYIRELYQENRLVQGTHAVAGRPVDLGRIRCPVLTVTTSRDTICPPAAALALNERVGSSDRRALGIPGGHVGAVVGERARTALYPALGEFFRQALG